MSSMTLSAALARMQDGIGYNRAGGYIGGTGYQTQEQGYLLPGNVNGLAGAASSQAQNVAGFLGTQIQNNINANQYGPGTGTGKNPLSSLFPLGTGNPQSPY